MAAKGVVKARDLMQRKVVTVRPNMLVGELARLLDDERISGAPVVDRDGHLVGVVSKSDLVHHEREGAEPYAAEGPRLPAGYSLAVPDHTRVADIMTPAVVEAAEDAPAAEIARLMRRKRIHRVFITRGQKLLGIVTTLDLLKLLEGRG